MLKAKARSCLVTEETANKSSISMSKKVNDRLIDWLISHPSNTIHAMQASPRLITLDPSLFLSLKNISYCTRRKYKLKLLGPPPTLWGVVKKKTEKMQEDRLCVRGIGYKFDRVLPNMLSFTGKPTNVAANCAIDIVLARSSEGRVGEKLYEQGRGITRERKQETKSSQVQTPAKESKQIANSKQPEYPRLSTRVVTRRPELGQLRYPVGTI